MKELATRCNLIHRPVLLIWSIILNHNILLRYILFIGYHLSLNEISIECMRHLSHTRPVYRPWIGLLLCVEIFIDDKSLSQFTSSYEFSQILSRSSKGQYATIYLPCPTQLTLWYLPSFCCPCLLLSLCLCNDTSQGLSRPSNSL
jgi:hypothetical protein